MPMHILIASTKAQGGLYGSSRMGVCVGAGGLREGGAQPVMLIPEYDH